MSSARNRVLLLVLVAAAGCALLAWRLGFWPGGPGGATGVAASPGGGAAGRPAPGASGVAAASDPGTLLAGTAPEPAGLLRLEGQVIDDADRPVAGATVTVSTVPRRPVRTEADGSFVVEGLLPRSYTVAALKDDGFAGPLAVRLTARTGPVILRLAGAGALEVTVVVAGTGLPLAGATVGLRDEAVPGASTGDDGRATVRPLGRGRHVLEARAAGYVPAVLLVAGGGRPGAVQRLLVELRKGSAVSGVVVDAGGKPVAGALVRALPGRGDRPGGGPGGGPFGGGGPGGGGGQRGPAGGPFGGGDPGASEGEVTHSDAEGRWVFAALPAGSFRFAASDETHGPGTTAPIALDGRTERSGLVIAMEDGARVAGTVVRRDGTPVASATVRAAERGRGGGPPRQTYTDASGRFQLAGLPRRPVQVVASGETGASDAVAVDLGARPEQEDLTIVLDVDGRIAGTVLDGHDQPVAGAQVTALPAPGGGRGGRALGALRLRGLPMDVTDSSGHFVLGGLADGTYRLRATRETAEPLALLGLPGAVEAQVGDTEVKLRLEEQGRVRGKVLFADGTAPASYRVAAGGPGLSFGGGGGGGGDFEVDAPVGEVSVTASGPQFLQATAPPVQVAADAVADVGTITVERGRTLSGLVLGSDGAPVAGATVVAGQQLFMNGSELASGPGVRTTTSGDDGRYLVAGVPPGSLLVAADEPSAGRSPLVRVPGGADSAEVDLTLLPPGTLSGRVTAAGRPLGGSLVTATPQSAGLGVFTARAADDGTYAFDKLAPDTYTVSARTGAPGRGAAQGRTIAITAGQAAHLDVDVPAGTITVATGVAGPPGSDVKAAQVVLVTGVVQATTAAQLLDALAARGDAASHSGFVFLGRPAQLAGVAPGPYTACAVPLPASVVAARDVAALRDRLDRLVCACAPVTIADAPETQSLTLPVPPAPTL